MATIPPGFSKPFFKNKPKTETTDAASKPFPVPSFQMDIYPVTESQFSQFVSQHPEWKKTKIKRIFADPQYLTHSGSPRSPVVTVSWFAAKAFCEAQGKSLPTVAQWEYVADNSGKDEASITQLILNWYGKPNPKNHRNVGAFSPNLYGIYDLYDLVWEWTIDYNSGLVSSESRAPEEKQSSLFCGGGSESSTNAADYAQFMRDSFRSSLKGNYTTANLGFRCVKNEKSANDD